MLRWLMVACVCMPAALGAEVPPVQAPIDTIWLPADTVWLPADTVWTPPDTVWVPSDTVYVQLPPDTVQAPDVVMPPDTVVVQLPPDTVQAGPVDPEPPVDPPVDPPAGNVLWSTTFDSGEVSDWGPGLPDNLSWKGGPWAGETVVTSVANRSAGKGGRGARYYAGPGTNNGSSTMQLVFSKIGVGAQSELWIQWYQRWEAGYAYSNLSYDKQLYMYTAAGNILIPETYGSDGYRFYGERDAPQTSSGGWRTIMEGGASDGLWHSFEIHYRMDTNSANGVAQVWVDGSLIIDDDDVNWSGGSADIRAGITDFHFLSNQAVVSVGGYVDIDDIEIYNTTPPNVDGAGNPRIGSTF